MRTMFSINSAVSFLYEFVFGSAFPLFLHYFRSGFHPKTSDGKGKSQVQTGGDEISRFMFATTADLPYTGAMVICSVMEQIVKSITSLSEWKTTF